ncbi:MAG: type II toxin-antitoxin system Phd/YefM family antitoxin [Rhizomicrobium sp.]
MTEWSLEDAKDRFGEVVTAAHQAPQLVTKDGKPAVVVVDAAEFERLGGKTQPGPQTKLMPDGKEHTFIDHLLAIPKVGPDDLFERVRPKRRDIDF